MAVLDGAIVPDPGQHLPGRGAYVCVNRDCLSRALKRGGLQRRLKVPPGAAGGLEQRLGVEG
jgi:predicted RNA-binding protein YlxR (DUF448 family)